MGQHPSNESWLVGQVAGKRQKYRVSSAEFLGIRVSGAKILSRKAESDWTRCPSYKPQVSGRGVPVCCKASAAETTTVDHATDETVPQLALIGSNGPGSPGLTWMWNAFVIRIEQVTDCRCGWGIDYWARVELSRVSPQVDSLARAITLEFVPLLIIGTTNAGDWEFVCANRLPSPVGKRSIPRVAEGFGYGLWQDWDRQQRRTNQGEEEMLGPGFPVWVPILATIIIGVGFWAVRYMGRPANKARVQSEMAKAHSKQKCETCSDGVIDLTDPTRELSVFEQLSQANAAACPCCNGDGFHMVVRGTKWVCKKYAADSR